MIEVVKWAGGSGRRAVSAAVAEPRAIVVRGIISAAACAEIAGNVWADAPTVLLVPRPGEDIVSYSRNAWTRAAHAPARLRGAGPLRGQARLDLAPCFDVSRHVPTGLLGGHALNAADSCIFVTSAKMRTPLHSDERHGMLLHVAGDKNFVTIPAADSDKRAETLKKLLRLRDKCGDHATIYPTDPPDAALRGMRRLQGALEAGDALFIPQRWLHDIESRTPTISVSLRFGNWDAPN
ncbi:hypothetical protein M885DRAFT_543358 [Pelagophyceae sp. CCMP2097]|nr:hypothetical protein M885DRAFT_543358 [Pelagophyceae sp. CCMP2097]|mmetsp:Transcript_19377/g.65450  ORF Transcript_19377/g.65450 Transcript_19377/m.65450 type:complete len:237 (-) Transcript_19377:45-755(-)